MSATHSWSGAVAVKSRQTRSSWTGGPGVRPDPRDRRARALGPGDPPQASRPHEAVDGAARDLVALSVHLGVDLADPVDPVVGRVDVLDHRRGRRVRDRPRRGRAGLGRVVGARGDLLFGADRLDPETVLVLVDVLDDHFSRRSSSAAAKNADAVRKISFARRSSRFSRSSSATRCASAVVVPARSPASTSAWLTHPRNVSGLIPSCSPTRCNAPVRVTGSRRASTAIRIARSRSSSGYFLGATMTLILSGIESLHQTRHETQTHRAHAVIENVHADLKASALAHLPSGVFNANAAWLVCAVMAFNLTRAAATITGPSLARATTATIRRKIITVPARIATSARRLHLHLPAGWPWAGAWIKLFDHACGPPPPATT